MKIPDDAVIADAKVRDYLLKPRFKADKSRYLAIAGYTRENFQQLANDLRAHLLPADAVYQRTDEFGEYYSVKGKLRGPNGRRLGVETIWLKCVDGEIRFLTLMPD